MKLLLMLAFLASLTGTLALGGRLMRAGLRHRGTPELVYGASLCVSGMGSIVRVIVYGIIGVSEETRPAVVLASCFSVATLAIMTTGLRLIYHPRERWPWVLQALLVAVSLTGTFHLAYSPIATGLRPFAQMLNDVASTAMMVWGAIEGFAYWSKLRRRRELGIAEPLVVERFRLWGAGFAVGACASSSLWLTPLLLGQRIIDVAWISAAANLAIVSMTALTWMAFYPPQPYRRRVARTAEAH